jgi:8-oxo-dGTP diphosphatase
LSTPSPVPVVCAVIIDGTGRVLLAQRPPEKHLGMKWEFPGGKVEDGESPQRALIREIKEELGCDIVFERALPLFNHDYGIVVIRMIPFVCTLAPGSTEPHPHEHIALRWVPVTDLPGIDLAPADWPVVESCHAATSKKI